MKRRISANEINERKGNNVEAMWNEMKMIMKAKWNNHEILKYRKIIILMMNEKW